MCPFFTSSAKSAQVQAWGGIHKVAALRTRKKCTAKKGNPSQTQLLGRGWVRCYKTGQLAADC